MERDNARQCPINGNQDSGQRIALSLSTTAWEILNQQARSQGISPSVLIEQWAHQGQDASGSSPDPGAEASAGFGCQQAEAARARANQELAASNAELLKLNEELQITLEELAVAEEELRQQNQQLEIERQRYQDLFNFAPDGYLVTDPQGRIQEVNQKMTFLLETEAAWLLGKPLSALIDLADAPRFRELLQQLPGRTGLQTVTLRIRPPRCSLFTAEVTVTGMRDGKGTLLGCRWLVRDISARLAADAALFESEERFRQLAENIDAAFWVLNYPQRQVVYVSPAYQRLWALDPQELYRDFRAWTARVHPDDRDRVEQAFQEKALAGQFNEEYRLQLDDGSWRWIRDRCYPVRNGAGAVYRLTGIAEDITEDKQAQAALLESQERLVLAMEAAGMGSWEWNLQTGAVVWSANLECLFGLTPGTFNGRYETVVNTIHPDDRERVLGAIWRSLQEKKDYNLEFRFFRADGAIRWALAKGRGFYDERGRPVRMTGVDLDITIRKQAEALQKDLLEREQQANERYRLATSAVNGLIYDWDIQRSYIERTEGLKQLVGYEPQEADPTVEWWQERIHPADLPHLPASAETTPTKNDCYEFEYRVRHRQGHYLWILDRGLILRDRSGRPRRVVGYSTDISDRKRTEESLHNALRRLELLVDRSPLAVIEWDGELRVKRWSVEAERLFGWPAAEVLGKRFGDWPLVLPQEWQQVAAGLASLQTGGESRQRICQRNYTKAGIVIQCEWHNSVIVDDGGHVLAVLSLVQDITQRLALEAERDSLLAQEQAARQQAETANRIKDEFLAVLSHELRSPLNPILGWCQLLGSRRFDEDKQAEGLATIERNARLLTQLIDDLLDVARILRGKMALDLRPVNLRLAIEGALETIRTAALAKEISLETNLAEVGPVAGDGGRLQQIVWNLLSNAVKFTPAGGRVTLRLEQVEGQAQIAVSDTGKGIRGEFLPYLFESFRQEDASITRRYGGLGLGLSIVRHLVELHGGTVTAYSEGENLGATFTVRLPLLPISKAVSLAEPSQKGVSLSGLRVLVVEDDEDSRQLLRFFLETYGAQVETLASAEKGLQIVVAFKPDLLISDISMPDEDGYSLLQRVRSLSADRGGKIPAIALTAYARPEDFQRALQVGFQQHLAKPLEPKRLLAAIRKAVAVPVGNSLGE